VEHPGSHLKKDAKKETLACKSVVLLDDLRQNLEHHPQPSS